MKLSFLILAWYPILVMFSRAVRWIDSRFPWENATELNMKKPLCVLTMGDPAGVGPEVILKTLFSARARRAADMVVIGYPGPFERDAGLLNLDVRFRETASLKNAGGADDTVDIIVPDRSFSPPLDYGVVDERCGRAAGLSIVRSAELTLGGGADAVVTAPINKESLNAAGFDIPGHTEFYRNLTGAGEIAMMLTLGDFRVAHVTTHVAIKNVPALVRKTRIVTVASLFHEAVRCLGIEQPRLAVSGLNPHAGEAGMFGSEEITDIAPAVGELRKRGMEVEGPLPPDTVFTRAWCGEFDGVVAMFHDQGHIALKLAGFKLGGGAREVGGVNTTLGLPIVRTSVDHGTAFDIAGRGIASPLSMIEAVETAAALVKGRRSREI